MNALKYYEPHLQSVLKELQKLLAQAPKQELKKTPPKPRKAPQLTDNSKTSPSLDVKPLPTPEKLNAPLLGPPPPHAPTLHKSPDECDADKRLKAKKYREARKKEFKAQSLPKPPTTKEKVYEITSKIGHVIYGALNLPPETSPAIIHTAIRILEKGRLGLKNNQVKFVTHDEIKKRKLPINAHYKIKGEIIQGEEKGQLMRIYGVPDATTNIVVFSILVHKPHKADSIDRNQSKLLS